MRYFHEVKVSMSFSVVKDCFCGGQYELQGKKLLLRSPLAGGEKALDKIREMEIS